MDTVYVRDNECVNVKVLVKAALRSDTVNAFYSANVFNCVNVLDLVNVFDCV